MFGVVQTGFVNHDGVYVIGKLTETRSGGHSIGSTRYYAYFYNRKRYIYSIKDLNLFDSLVFIKVLPYQPSVSRIDDAKVPHCFDITMVPPLGWKELPKDTCR